MTGATRTGGGKVATLHAVAEAAGVSTATVSKALNGIPVSPENFAKVHAAAEALGYVPNEAARAMRGGKTMTIGIVVNLEVNPRTELMSVLDSFIGDMERGGYSVFLSVAKGNTDVNTLLRRFLERRVDGLVYWTAITVPVLAAYRRAGIPVLAVGYRDAESPLPLVTVDGTEVYDQLHRRLKELGHRKVAEVSPSQVSDLHERSAKHYGLAWEQRTIGFDRDSVRSFVAGLGGPDSPTVLFASYASAVQVLAACEDLGLRIPDDLSLVTLMDSEGAALLRTPLSVVRTDYEQLGHATSEAMFDAMAGKPVHDITVPGGITWVERSSIGPAPAPRR